MAPKPIWGAISSYFYPEVEEPQTVSPVPTGNDNIDEDGWMLVGPKRPPSPDADEVKSSNVVSALLVALTGCIFAKSSESNSEVTHNICGRFADFFKFLLMRHPFPQISLEIFSQVGSVIMVNHGSESEDDESESKRICEEQVMI